MEELNHHGVGFVSVTEVLDLTPPTGRAIAGLLSVLRSLYAKSCAGVFASALSGPAEWKGLGRPATAAIKSLKIRKLDLSGGCKAEIAGG